MPTRTRLRQAGFEEPLAIESFDLPEPGPGQVRIRVEACAVCHRDLIDRGGRFPWLQLPITPGHEAAGVVEAVGPEVTKFQVGDRVATLHRDHCGQCKACVRGDTSLCPNAVWVFGLVVDGGYATHLLAPVNALYPQPADLPAEFGSFLHCTVGTAWRGLVRQGQVQSGQRVLITGANGGVGAAAIQVAKRLGAEVVAVVRSEEAAAWVAELGADKTVVDPGTSFHKRVGAPADIALDCVGTPTFNSSLRSLRMGGRLVVIGNVTADRASFNLGYAIVNGLAVIGSSGATAEDMAEVLALHARTPFDLEALQDRVVPLVKADAAQLAVRSGDLRGRIVLDTR
jgi:acryloyl-coenzyme A reductase